MKYRKKNKTKVAFIYPDTMSVGIIEDGKIVEKIVKTPKKIKVNQQYK